MRTEFGSRRLPCLETRSAAQGAVAAFLQSRARRPRPAPLPTRTNRGAMASRAVLAWESARAIELEVLSAGERDRATTPTCGRLVILGLVPRIQRVGSVGASG